MPDFIKFKEGANIDISADAAGKAVVISAKDQAGPVAEALEAEREARAEADSELRAAIEDEAGAREGADSVLLKAISDEASARETGDTGLQSGIDLEAEAREFADGVLTSALGVETGAREDADEALQTALGGEAGTREDADEALQEALGAETSARTNADAALATSISNEANARAGADTALNSALGTEASTRAGADTTLQTNITAAIAAAKAYADALAVSGVHYRGEVADHEALPSTGMEIGDEYLVNDDGDGHSVFAIWDGAEWDFTSTDLSAYRTASAQDDIDAGKVDKNGTDSLMSADEHTKLSGIAAGADVSVNADWNASSGKAQVLNKPTIPTTPGEATQSAAGLMSAADKTKLDGIDADDGITFKVGSVII